MKLKRQKNHKARRARTSRTSGLSSPASGVFGVALTTFARARGGQRRARSLETRALADKHAMQRLRALKWDLQGGRSIDRLNEDFQCMILDHARLIANIASSGKQVAGFRVRDVRGLSKKLRDAATAYGRLASTHPLKLGLLSEGLMRDCAARLDSLLAAPLKPKQRAKMNPETPEILRLIEYVERHTGRPHYGALADILTAVYAEKNVTRRKWGQVQPEPVTFTEQSLVSIRTSNRGLPK